MSSRTTARSKVGNCQKRPEFLIMITGELKSKVDRIWNTMWSGGISNPLSVIEQLTYLLFIKGLDELHTRRSEVVNDLIRRVREIEVIGAQLIAAEQSGFSTRAPEQILTASREALRGNEDM